LEAGASRMDLVNCQPRVRPGPFSWPFPNPRRNVTLASPCRQTTFGTYLSHHRDNALTLAAARAANRELIERFEKKIELPLDRIRGEEEPVGLDAVA
jgi:hypothetical protein